MQQKVVIVGAGAAGVFTAYRLKEMYDSIFDVVLYEKNDRIGGNALSVQRTIDGRTYNIDAGAQFFYNKPQASYVELLEDLGLFDDDNFREIYEAPAGFTIWDKPNHEHRLYIPAELTGFVDYGLSDWGRMLQFLTYLTYSLVLDREDGSWTKSVDTWLDDCDLLSDEFKDEVIKNFMYQFVTLPHDQVGSASARYATTYFARNALGEPKVNTPHPDAPDLPGLPTFDTYQSRIGLDGVMTQALEAVGVVPNLSSEVTRIVQTPQGLEVHVGGTVVQADHVVLATDPQTSAKILGAGGTSPQAVEILKRLPYVPLPISLQEGVPCQMPADEDYWQPVNTIVDGNDITFTAWFGPLRQRDPSGNQIRVFKSWASPTLQPTIGNCASEFFSHTHTVVQPTTEFMATRDELAPHQGSSNIWFAGGWTNWFDSQEAALDSATAIAEKITATKARPGTGQARMVAVDHATHRRSLRRLANRVARRAPEAQKKAIRNVVDEVDASG